MSRRVAPARFCSFGDWLRFEDALKKIEDPIAITEKYLGLQIVSEDSTWEYIMDKCQPISDKVTINLANCGVYAFWTCPAFWELIRSSWLEKIIFYTDPDGLTGAELIGQLTGQLDILHEKVDMRIRQFTDTLADISDDIFLKKLDDNNYCLDLEPAFGRGGVLGVADMMLIERSIQFLAAGIPEDSKITVDLRLYDIGMIVAQVSELALKDNLEVYVAGSYLSDILREMAKLRERRSGLTPDVYADKVAREYVGRMGMLRYEKASRAFSLPAKVTGVAGGHVIFEVISPTSSSLTRYNKFEVEVALNHLAIDDVLAKSAGVHVFISDKFMLPEFVEGVLQKGFPEQ